MVWGNKRLFGYNGPHLDCYFYFIGWDHISLGMHCCLSTLNVEIHLPFGFIRIGRHFWKMYSFYESTPSQ